MPEIEACHSVAGDENYILKVRVATPADARGPARRHPRRRQRLDPHDRRAVHAVGVSGPEGLSADLHRYLQQGRDALLRAVDGVSEYDARRPPASESREYLVDLYCSVWAVPDAAIADLPLDAPASVAWWPEERRVTTVGHLLVRVVGRDRPARRARRHPA